MKGILSSKLATGMLMLAAFMANIFATMPCRGRCYEPMLPEELRHHTGGVDLEIYMGVLLLRQEICST